MPTLEGEQPQTQTSIHDQIVEREQRVLLSTYGRYPLALARGKGVYVEDYSGRKYLDFLSGLGVNALGHAHKRIVKVIREQAGQALHFSNLYYHEYQGLLAEKLTRLSGLDRAFFCNSGTEAMEAAIKIARAAGHKTGGDAKSRLVALDNSFHGRTFGALSVTGQGKYREGFEPLLEGVRFLNINDVEGLRAAVDDSTCAVILEPIQGEGGIRVCSAEFLRAARDISSQHQAALIFDEIQCGLGRTGMMFDYQHAGVIPDIVTLAKPMAAGLPMGAIVCNAAMAAAITPGKHGTTFGGGPLACRVALEYLAVIEEEGVLENVRRVGAYFRDGLEQLQDKFAIAREVRGRGLMLALDLDVPSKPYMDAALAEGILINSTSETVLRFLPPFLIQEKHADKVLKVLKKLLKKKLGA
ncbi:MAG: aspartate aminotransferase family protein [Candidatus Korobacteraceae bacterium]